jgi:hypothetical protein
MSTGFIPTQPKAIDANACTPPDCIDLVGAGFGERV